jgi:hypothetical protein
MNPKVFDDNAKNQNNVPNNLPTEPEDMLAGVDKVSGAPQQEVPNALKSGLLKPREAATILPNPDYTPPAKQETITVETKKSKGMGVASMAKVVMIIVVVFGVMVFGYGGWVIYTKYATVSDSNKTEVPKFEANEQKTENNNVANNQTATSTEQNPAEQNNPVVDTVDSDDDGLKDQEEKQIGTDPNNPDTDGDKLSDMDEVRVWLTDPLKADTDGDGYADGAEILGGYNPKGPGKFTPTLPIVRFVSSTGPTSSYNYINNPIKTQ